MESHRYPRERDHNEHKFTSEKLQCILKSYRIIYTFYIESNLHKLLCKPKDRVATKDKKNIVYEIDCSNCEAVYMVNLNEL